MVLPEPVSTSAYLSFSHGDGVRSSYVLNLAAFTALRTDLEELVALLPQGNAVPSSGAEQ